MNLYSQPQQGYVDDGLTGRGGGGATMGAAWLERRISMRASVRIPPWPHHLWDVGGCAVHLGEGQPCLAHLLSRLLMNKLVKKP